MKKYNEFILFEGLNSSGLRRGSRAISEVEFKKLLFENCKEFLADPKLIWKNSRLAPIFYYTNPKSSQRLPSNPILSNLIYDHFLNISEKWKYYPKRSNSVICYSKKFKNSIYGNYMFNIIPYDNSKWVISSTHDFWHTFENLISLNMFFERLLKSLIKIKFLGNKDLYNKVSKIDIDNILTDVEINKNIHKEIVKELKKIKFDDIDDYTYDFYGFKDLTIYDGLNKLLKPEGNVKLSTYSDLRDKFKKINPSESNLEQTQEIYTDSKCLYAPEGYINKLLENEEI